MVQILEKKDLDDIAKVEEVYVVIPEKEAEVKVIEEKKPKKKSRLFKKHKKAVNINNVKRNVDSNMYRNRFAMR
ncbi:MAG: hypothetical protein ACXACO_22120 [Promethearchaeota archaeon]